MLQSFGTELAETELPDDVYSIERILALRTEKYCQLKVGLSGSSPSLLPRQVGHLRSDRLFALSASHSSFPHMYVAVPADDMKCSRTISVCYAYILLSLIQRTSVPASSKLFQLPAAYWIAVLGAEFGVTPKGLIFP